MSRSARPSIALALVLALGGPALAQSKPEAPRNYGVGHVATPEQLAGWDIDVRPDGQGAPLGRGSVKDGEKVYMEKCAACHGEFGESAGRWPQIAQGKGTLASHDPVVAYVLNLNDIVDENFVLSKETWAQVKMPNRGGFFDDDREKSEKAFWNPNPCMKDCRGPAGITGRALSIDVTPDEKTQKRGVE